MKRLISCRTEKKIGQVKAVLDHLQMAYELWGGTDFMVSDEHYGSVMTTVAEMMTGMSLESTLYARLDGKTKDLAIEIQRVTSRLREAWAGWALDFNELEWVVAYYPIFAAMALAMVEDQNSAAALAFEHSYRSES
jgi:hypothetical protein